MGQKRGRERLFEIKRKKTMWKRRLIIVGFLCGVFCVLFVPTQFRIWKLQGQIRNYRQQEQELLVNKQEILEKIDYYSSDAYIEERARQELGLVKPGEIPIRPGVPGRDQPPQKKTGNP